MCNKTFKQLYEDEKNKATPAQSFIATVADITHRSTNTVKMWLVGRWKSHTNLTHPGKYFRPSKVKIMRPTSPK